MRPQPAFDLLLVRSGRTEWEEAGRAQGSVDLPLSTSGRAAAVALTNHLAGSGRLHGISQVVSSSDEASAETAELIAERVGARPRMFEALNAMALGLWEGKLEQELIDIHGSSYRAWRADPATVTPPQGEPFTEGRDRILGRLARFCERASGRGVAVVLRPMEFGLARAVAAGQSTSDLWAMVEFGPMSERARLTPERLTRPSLTTAVA